MQKIAVGKREFSQNIARFLKIAETETVVITDRGKEVLVIKSSNNNDKFSDYYKSVTVAKIDEILADMLGSNDIDEDM